MPSNKQKKQAKASNIKRRQIEKNRKQTQQNKTNWAVRTENLADDESTNRKAAKAVEIDKLFASLSQDARKKAMQKRAIDVDSSITEDSNIDSDSSNDNNDAEAQKETAHGEDVDMQDDTEHGIAADDEVVADIPGTSGSQSRAKRSLTYADIEVNTKKRKTTKPKAKSDKQNDYMDEITTIIITIQALFPAKGA